MTADTLETRSPSDVGYSAWILHRVSALALVVLLAIHLGVQLFPQYGFTVVAEVGLYRPLLTATLVLVLLHGFLGVRATLLETSIGTGSKRPLVWLVGSAFLVFLALRLIV